jgi:hypothetical protein
MTFQIAWIESLSSGATGDLRERDDFALRGRNKA